jgi:lauroyl/myristoyl acyltransferase
MRKHSYKLAIYLSNHIGLWVFRIFSWFIATGYFLFFPGRVGNSRKFYCAVFPSHGLLYHLLCVWRQYHNFTDVFLDRFLVHKGDAVEFTKEGWEHLDAAMEKKTGAIIVMSHISNWEVAAQKLGRKGMPVMLYLGEKHKEQIEHMQKETLAKNGIKIIATAVNEGSPFALVDGINFLREGGVVSITGDRLWGDQRAVTARFLGHEVQLPDFPHIFAMVSGAPLFTFFIYQTAPRKYHIKMSEGRYVKAADRKDRKKAISESVQIYATELEKIVREHPLEWYHFEPFLGEKIDDTKMS